MPKRIALLILGFALFIGAFFIYQLITGASILSHKTIPPAIVTTGPAKPLTFENRTATGELRYVITARTMEEQKTPGQFLLHDPVATFYTHDGRAITIRGDSCEVAVDQIRHVNSASTGEPPSVRDGRLSGNIVLTIGGKSDSADAIPAGDIVVRFEKDLTLNGAEQTLTSPGKVQVRSNVIVFDGEGFTLNYSMDKTRAENQRVEFFRIEKGNKIILKNKGAHAFDLDTTKPAGKSPAAPATPVNPEDQPTSYALSFGKEITATHGTTVLTSDQLFVLFTAPSNREVIHDINKPLEDQTPATPAKPAAMTVPPPQLSSPAATRPLAAVEPMGEAGPDDLVITWVGPMEMRPAEHPDVQLVDSKDIALEAVGTPERPVKISEPRRSVEAGKLWYHKATQSLELQPLPNDTVQFSTIATNATEATTVSCAAVSVSLDEKGQNAKHVRLAGPGKITLPPSALSRKQTTNVPLIATWGNTLDVDLDIQPDPKNAKRTIQAPRHVVLTNTSIKDADFDIAADTLDAQLANIDGASALEHLLATGNVLVNSHKKNDSGLQAQRLEVLTAMFPTSKTPLPTKVIADGEVSAWQYAAKKTGPNNTAVASNYRKETVFGPHLEADLAPRSKSSPAATQSTDSALADFASFGNAAGGGNVELKHFLVNDGVRIAIESNKGEPVEVLADKLEANLPLATLSGKDADHPVHITYGKDDITGALVLLDQSKNTFTIPGPGNFLFVPTEKKGKQTAPLNITWSKQMQYDQKAQLATFTGDITATSKGKSPEPHLTCDRQLLVKLHGTGKSGDNADLETADAGRLDFITADGNVKSEAIQLDDAGNTLTRMDLQDVDSLTYTGADETLTIPGKGTLLLIDFRPEKQKSADAQSSRGTTTFTWNKEFKYDTAKGAITFTRNVEMRYLPVKPLRVALGKDTGADAAPKKPSMVTLNTELLQATLIRSKEAAAVDAAPNPVGLGSGGNLKLATVHAGGTAGMGAASITMEDYSLSGYAVDFDALKNLVTISSNESVPATVTRTGHGMVEADEIAWDLTKNNEAFDFKNPRGNVEAMPDLENPVPQN